MHRISLYQALLYTLIIALGVFGLFSTSNVSAVAGANVDGYAWSENIGWIHMNGALYGVNVAAIGGLMSGQAWSEHVGWITFTRGDLVGCPSGTCEARFDKVSGRVSGWARAVGGNFYTGANEDGWDGWISLSGSTQSGGTYGVYADGCNWKGYAWGGDVIGWIKFNNDADGDGVINTDTNGDYGVVGTVATASCAATATFEVTPAVATISKIQTTNDPDYANSNKIQLQALYYPTGLGGAAQDVTSVVTWTNGGANGMALVNKGLVTGQTNTGVATIKASYTTGGKTFVNSGLITVGGLTVQPSSITLQGGLSQQFSANADGITGTPDVTAASSWSASSLNLTFDAATKGKATAKNVTESGISTLTKYAVGLGRYIYGKASVTIQKVTGPGSAILELSTNQLNGFATHMSSPIDIANGGDVWMTASTGNVAWCALTSDLSSTITYPGGGSVQLNPMVNADINDQNTLRQPVKLKAINLSSEGTYTISLECMGADGTPVSTQGLVRVLPAAGTCEITPVAGQVFDPLKFTYPLIKKRSITFTENKGPYSITPADRFTVTTSGDGKTATIATIGEPPVVGKGTYTLGYGSSCTFGPHNFEVQVIEDPGEF